MRLLEKGRQVGLEDRALAALKQGKLLRIDLDADDPRMGMAYSGQTVRVWKRLRDDLLQRQQPDGRWLNSVGPGDAFGTAVACLLLRLPAQYLPIFQR